jgi:class 3 adenylate cyclase
MAGDRPSANGVRAVQAVPDGARAEPTPPTTEVRIGDRERDEVVDRLRLHVGSGHLTLDEFAERVDAALRATTASELRPLVADLPEPNAHGAGAPNGAGPATATAGAGVPPPTSDRASDPFGEHPPPKRRSTVISIMCGADTRGRWRPAPRVTAFAFWGGACVDLRDALIDTPVVDVYAMAIMGGVTVLVPEGIPVELDGFVLMGGSTNRTNAREVLPGAPLIRVHASGMWGGVEVRTKSSRSEDGHAHAADTLDAVAQVLEKIPVPPQPPASASSPPAGPPPAPPSGPPPGASSGPSRSGPLRPAGPARVPSRTETPTILPEGTLTIMFTDIVDSTASVEAMGDQRWSGVVAAHDRALRDVVSERGGTVVKGNGDGYLVVFTSARQAVLAGIDLRDVATVPLRIGLHTGEVVRQDGDIYGRNVIAASRIAGVAAPGDVVVSALTKDLVESAGDLAFSAGRSVELKGLAQPWTVHEVAFDRGAATAS